MNELLNYLNTSIRLDADSEEKLRSICSEASYTKGDYLLKENDYCRHLFFINHGLVKLSFDTGEVEFVMRFFQENQMLTELESITSNKPSKYQILALETVNCTLIPYVEFLKISLENPKLSSIITSLLSFAHINMMNRIREMLESNARKRYNNFLENNPDIINRISLGELSKYLGINQVTLSRIRNKK